MNERSTEVFTSQTPNDKRATNIRKIVNINIIQLREIKLHEGKKNRFENVLATWAESIERAQNINILREYVEMKIFQQ